MQSTAETLREVLPWLRDGGDVPPTLPVALLEDSWLAPLAFHRLGDAAHPDRARLNAAFTQSFQRRALLDRLWREALGALSHQGVEVISLGSLPFAEDIYPHAGARFSQDIDLLVRPAQEAEALQALEALGWQRNRRLRLLEREGVQLDMHTTPGEEARAPVLSEVFGQSSEYLFREAIPHRAGGLQLPMEVLLDNRVIHFFKHACEKPLHGLEIALLLAQPHDQAQLESVKVHSSSGPIWDFVLGVLSHWGLTDAPIDGRDSEAIQAAANLQLGFGLYRVIASMMPLSKRLRYAKSLLWPPREELLKTFGVAEAGLAEYASLRALRIRKFLNALFA